MSIIYINPFQFGPGYDSDAQDFINRVIAADVAAGNTSGLEVGVQDAYNTFFVGCKADGIFSALKASCILAGARTQSGAMVPLVSTMPAPTMFGTVAGWNYNRKTGLAGNGTDNYLDSNRNNNDDPQDDQHFFCQVSSAPTSSPTALMGAGGTDTGSSHVFVIGGGAYYRSRINSSVGPSTHSAGGLGASRSSSASFSYLSSPGVTSTSALASQTPYAGNMHVFQRNATPPITSDARIAFYSIGESLDLALLDTRVSTLMSDLAAAIP